ncbi:expressed unknown protein [Seminavis robusta]|uniref:PLOD1-3-like GT domain-containing protein n=1 Tax=Seminavis robusta TaxID=568900 RepID=A0A9N8ER21_9STRA|nr:expressed unknown protein [Seminavis robusta]|eukprot:Sro1837_g300750.1 n/a (354) ;mRNA; r:12400-13655
MRPSFSHAHDHNRPLRVVPFLAVVLLLCISAVIIWSRNQRSSDFLQVALAEKRQRPKLQSKSGTTIDSTTDSKNNQLLVITPLGNSTSNEKGVHALKCSMKFRGHNPEHLIRAKFDDKDGYGGLDVKKIRTILKTLQELLSQQEWPATTLILVVDAFDVVIQANPQEILQAYDAQPYPILFGAEAGCWNPVTKTLQSTVSAPLCTLPTHQTSIAKGLYLNSGVFLSTLGTLAAFLDHELNHQELPTEKEGLVALQGFPGQFNDQAYWGYWYTKYHPLIGIDNTGDNNNKLIIANIGRDHRSALRFDITTGLFALEDNNNGKQKQVPPVMHFPGSHPKLFKPYIAAKRFFEEHC